MIEAALADSHGRSRQSRERATSGHAELYCLRMTNPTPFGASVVRSDKIVSVVISRL